MFDNLTLAELIRKLFVYCMVVLMVVSIYRAFKRKTSRLQGDTPTRIWRRMQFANMDIMRNMNERERQEFIETFNNTVKNAEMWKDKKSLTRLQSSESSKKSPSKGVQFNERVHILGPRQTSEGQSTM